MLITSLRRAAGVVVAGLALRGRIKGAPTLTDRECVPWVIIYARYA